MTTLKTSSVWIKWPARVAAGLLLISGTLIWLAGTGTTLHWMAGQAEARSGGRLSLTEVEGSLYGPIRIKSLRYEDATIRVVAEDVAFDWSPRQWLMQHRVELRPLQAGVVDVKFKTSGAAPAAMPTTLRLPLPLVIPDAAIARIVVESGSRQYTFSGLQFSFVPEGQRHRLKLSRLATPWGSVTADVSVGQDPPFALNATGRFSAVGTADSDVRIEASGTLDQLALNLDGTAGTAKFSGHVVVQPFERTMLHTVDLQASGINPAEWRAAWPTARIDLNAHAGSDHAGTLSGDLHLRNALPGTLDQQRLPLLDLSATLGGTPEQIRLANLALNLTGAARLHGSMQIGAGSVSAELAATALNLRGLHSKLAPTKLTGALHLTWDGSNGTLLTDLAQSGYRFHVDASQTGDQLTLRDGLIQAGRGELAVSGKMSFAGAGEFQSQGALRHFDPSLLGDFPAAQINASMTASGRLFGQRRILGRFDIVHSSWAGQVLAGSGRLTLEAERLARLDATLRLAENQLTLSGSLGAAGDSLSLKLDAPDLSRLGTDFSGSAAAEGTIAGSYADPAGTVTATFSGFKWMTYQFASGRLSAQLTSGMDGPANLSAHVADFRHGALALSAASIDLHGTRSHHQAALTARSESVDLHAALSGGWTAGTGWHGELEKLENQGRYPLQLQAPAALTAGTDHAALRGAQLHFARGALMINEASYQNGELATSGNFSGISASDLQHMSGSSLAMDLSLILAGSWDLHATRQLDGTLDIRRESGDIVVQSEPKTALGLSALELRLSARQNHINAQASVEGERLGSMSAQGVTSVSRRDGAWGIDGSAPLQGTADVSVQSLAWLAPLISPALLTEGSLRLQFAVKGSVNTHQFEGNFSGSNLRLELPDQGLYLKGGELRGDLADDRVMIRQLAFNSGAGRLSASGEAHLQQGVPQATLALVADQAELSARPDRLLIASGKVAVSTQASHVHMEGKLRADRGMIELPRDNLPTLSDDVVVIGQENAARQQTARMNIDMDMEFDLGEQFFLKGRGLDAQLAGTVRLRSNGSGLPLANGSISVTKGDYSAYGQRLVIDRGILNFSGPLDNPGLNIIAMRKKQTVEAGVSVTGTALAPQVTLVSNPSVPDSEKMSWLVLGHGLEGSSTSELSLIGTAASALLAAGESVTLQSHIAHAAGLDEFGLSGTGDLASTVVTMGKRLSSRAYLSYEQSVMGISNLVKIDYTLSKRWSVRAQGGTDNAVDLFFTLPFD